MDPIKEAFQRAKQDIDFLRSRLEFITQELQEIKRTIQLSNKPILDLTNQQTHPSLIPTNQHITPTDTPTHSNTPTDKMPLYSLKSQFSETSTGNRGVPTDRQTDRQTDQQADLSLEIRSEPDSHSLNRITDALDSLDSFKKDLRRQFKSLTSQEFLIFSTIYQLEQEQNTVDYPLLAQRLKLSESSIRDYILKITRKGVPLLKSKLDNKKIILSIPEELKKIASLQALITLREL